MLDAVRCTLYAVHMRIIGIDPGYERLGIAVVEKNSGKELLLHSECFQTDPKLSFHERLFLLGEQLEKVITTHKPAHLALENVFFNTNQKTAMDVAAVRGVILYVGHSQKLQTFEYTPPQIKAAVGGSGRASKKEIASMLHHLIDINKTVRYDDEYDAMAVALTHSACFVNLSTGYTLLKNMEEDENSNADKSTDSDDEAPEVPFTD